MSDAARIDILRENYTSMRTELAKVIVGQEEIVEQILKTLKASNQSRAYVRIIISRGESEINLDPSKSPEISAALIAIFIFLAKLFLALL